jgi:hypothetical protein
MSRIPPPAISVPGYLGIRSDDDTPKTASFASSTPDPQAAQVAVDAAAVADDLNVRRSSAQVGIIFGTLLAFGVLLFLLYLLYRKRDGSVFSGVAWWRKRKIAEAPSSVNVSDPTTVQEMPSNDGLPEAAYDGTLNESKQNLVLTAPEGQLKQSLIQKIQQALFGAFKSKAKQDAEAVDMEKGPVLASPEAGSIRTESTGMSAGEWSRRPPSADMSIQTKSSMAIHPAVGRIKSEKKTRLRPGVSAFSWSTTAPTPVPPSHATMRENPLPALPSQRDPKRDTSLTTMTEDSEPTRHRSVNSWVENMQTRQEKRERRQQNSAHDMGPTHPTDLLALPPPVANPNGRNAANYDEQSFRLSAVTFDSNVKTPALQTATMAWHVHQGPGQVRVPPMPRSATLSQNPGLGLQVQTSDDDGDQNQHVEQEVEVHSQPNDYSQQTENSQQAEYPEQGEHSQEGDYPQQAEYLQQEQYSQDAEYAQQDDHPQEDTEHPDYDGAEYYHEGEEYPQQQYEYDSQHQEQQQAPPEIHINSSSEASSTIPEEEWIPNITRYPSGTTDMSGHVPSDGGHI